jgi:hypothetical protein
MTAWIRGRVRFWLIAFSVAANLVVMLLLAHGLFTAYSKLQYARVFPSGGPVARSMGGFPASADMPTIGFWGDSRSLDWARYFGRRAFPVLDRSVGGQTSAQLLNSLRVAPVPKVRVSIVQVGINDLHSMRALPVPPAVVISSLKTNLSGIRDALQERSEVVVMSTIFPPGRVPFYRIPVWHPQTLDAIGVVNDYIRSLAIPGRVLILDADVLADSSGYIEQKFRSRDGFFLHVNELAYAMLEERLPVEARARIPTR